MVNSLYIFNPDTLRRKAATRNKVCGFPDLQQRYLQILGGAYMICTMETRCTFQLKFLHLLKDY